MQSVRPPESGALVKTRTRPEIESQSAHMSAISCLSPRDEVHAGSLLYHEALALSLAPQTRETPKHHTATLQVWGRYHFRSHLHLWGRELPVIFQGPSTTTILSLPGTSLSFWRMSSGGQEGICLTQQVEWLKKQNVDKQFNLPGPQCLCP